MAVSILPQKTFVKRLIGEQAEVLVLLPPGANPAVYEPSPRQAAALARAVLYFRAGVPFEGAWMARIQSAAPRLKIVHLNDGIPVEDHDPHTWLSPPIVYGQIDTMAREFIAAFPQESRSITQNKVQFQQEIKTLDQTIAKRLAPYRNRAILVMHPSWNYFARTYHLRLLVVEEHGRERGAGSMARLIESARKEGIKTVYGQPEFDQRPAAVIAREIGGRVQLARPLSEEWQESLDQFSQELVAEFQKERSARP